jgi:hypothetical protein
MMSVVMRREAFWFVLKWVSAIFLIPSVQASIQKTRTSLCSLSEFCWRVWYVVVGTVLNYVSSYFTGIFFPAKLFWLLVTAFTFTFVSRETAVKSERQSSFFLEGTGWKSWVYSFDIYGTVQH